MRSTAAVFAALTACALLACAADDGDGDLIEPQLTPGKADVGDRVSLRGPLALGGEVAGAFTEDLQFDAYTIDVRPGARVTLDVTQRGSSRGLDTTMFVYGPATAAGYGTRALATDNDSGYGALSRLRDLRLADGGRYLVVLGTRDARGRGSYRVTAACASGECAPLTTSTCPAPIADDIRGCVDDLQADPETAQPTVNDAIALCADAEPVADAYDAACAASPRPAFCAGSYETFATTVLPACAHELVGEILDGSCVFGHVYRDSFTSPAIVVTHARKLTSVAGLSTLERAQLVSAVQASAHTDVTTAEQALDRVDQHEVNQTELWDASARRAFTVYEYGSGDNSYGRFFAQGTTTVAANIHDGDLSDCTATWGDERRDCATDGDCASGLSCVGVVSPPGRGVCIDRAAALPAGEGDTCSAPAGCAIGSGLVCAGLSRGDQGLCAQAWTTRRFSAAPALAIPDRRTAGVDSQLLVYGLATVDTDVRVRVTIDHPALAQLKLVLVNPAGTEVVVFDGATTTVPELWNTELPVRGFSGDESVNGLWTLRAIDRTSGQTGTLSRWSLDLGSRWD